MTIINRPNHAAINTLTLGQKIRVNGKRLTVSFVGETFVGVDGPRGGCKALVPSICGSEVQLSSLGSAAREWIETLEY